MSELDTDKGEWNLRSETNQLTCFARVLSRKVNEAFEIY